MSHCWNCGNQVDQGYTVCPYCQENLGADGSSFLRCSNGHIIPEGAEFCPWCGEKAAQQPLSPNDSWVTAPNPLRKTIKITNESDRKRTVIQRPGQDPVKDEGLPALVGFLVSFSLDKEGAFFPLREGRQTIGQGPKSRIKIDDKMLSEEHAVILYRNDKFVFEDKLSSNGSKINGVEAEGQKIIQHGDILGLGAHTYVLVTLPPKTVPSSIKP
ncbi:MAG: FHA domain-containing protein [Deltaproteobacteria bacterium]|jgi:RNA polymerase subunit RPABC4/transcription elongation factor Spt4|nr:FHA domain-containing protein [Deltaproteobacteria bacterium]